MKFHEFHENSYAKLLHEFHEIHEICTLLHLFGWIVEFSGKKGKSGNREISWTDIYESFIYITKREISWNSLSLISGLFLDLGMLPGYNLDL